MEIIKGEKNCLNISKKSQFSTSIKNQIMISMYFLVIFSSKMEKHWFFWTNHNFILYALYIKSQVYSTGGSNRAILYTHSTLARCIFFFVVLLFTLLNISHLFIRNGINKWVSWRTRVLWFNGFLNIATPCRVFCVHIELALISINVKENSVFRVRYSMNSVCLVKNQGKLSTSWRAFSQRKLENCPEKFSFLLFFFSFSIFFLELYKKKCNCKRRIGKIVQKTHYALWWNEKFTFYAYTMLEMRSEKENEFSIRENGKFFLCHWTRNIWTKIIRFHILFTVLLNSHRLIHDSNFSLISWILKKTDAVNEEETLIIFRMIFLCDCQWNRTSQVETVKCLKNEMAAVLRIMFAWYNLTE